MSYILEALKKSEAERQQGKAPDINTIQATESFQRKRRRIWPYVIAAAFILNAGSVVVALWLWDHREHAVPLSSDLMGRAQPRLEEETPPYPSAKTDASIQPPAVQASNSPEIPTGADESVVSVSSSDAPPIAAPSAQPDPGGTDVPTVASSPRGATAVPEPSALAGPLSNKVPETSPGPGERRAASVRGKSNTKPADQPSPEPPVTSVPPEAKAQRTRQPVEAKKGFAVSTTPPNSEKTPIPPKVSGLQQKLPSMEVTPPRKHRRENASGSGDEGPGDLHDLPPAVKNEVPRLSVSFLVYSSQPEARMVTINGKRMREGEEVSEGLRLEQITPDGVLLNWKGRRFHKGVF